MKLITKDVVIKLLGAINLSKAVEIHNTKYQYLRQINESFLATSNVCNLEQIVEFPRRGFHILEIVATNRPNFAGLSDHGTAVIVELDCHAKKLTPKKRKIFLWNKVDSNNLKIHVTKFLKSYTQDT